MIRSESFGIEYLEQFYITVSLLLLECNSDDNIRLQLELIGELQDLATTTDSTLRLKMLTSLLCTLCVSVCCQHSPLW